MGSSNKVEAYYNEAHRFRSALGKLRELALSAGLEETFKWNFPTYTLKGKNVLSICRFKNHFGIWFFNGVFLEDPKKVLKNAQKGKTQAMRHWKFSDEKEIDVKAVYGYMLEAIENQKKGIRLKPAPKAHTYDIEIPELLQKAFQENPKTKKAFQKLTPYKQKEYTEYIADAKRESTKLARLEKILPMILAEKGLNDAYR
ncbi:YdeI/OmpD-associated family protein [Pareuzebyella sediminis]|uniref:YdeI/OmpD-associated family protein n=1 Tax=Pareuzebyella sediminis TaxID=2607998 RepID=UPI0011EF8A00|nr:YdeI/OmpD-associated family protein [Pareuzebyella sediminis]